MTTRTKVNLRHFGIDKTPIQKIIAEEYDAMGIVPDPTMTPEELQEKMRAAGIRPEDNLASRGIIAARNEKWDEET